MALTSKNSFVEEREPGACGRVVEDLNEARLLLEGFAVLFVVLRVKLGFESG